METVACLANGRGGTLLLGVEDDGRVSGFGPLPLDPARLAAFILNKTQPNIAVEVSTHQVQGQTVVAVEVPDVTRVVGTKGGVYKRRALRADGGPECIPYLPEEMLSDGLFAAGQDYAALPAIGLSMSDLSQEQFDRFRRLCHSEGSDSVLTDLADVELCRALRVWDSSVPQGRPTIGAVLLFGKAEALDRVVPTAEVQFQVRTETDQLRRNETLRAPLFETFEWLVQHVDAFNEDQELMLGMQRVAVPRFVRSVMREVIANALVHRDYTVLGPVRVLVSPAELTVINPGGLPRGVELSNLLDISVPRSVILADAFKRAGLVDRAGRGIRRMFQAQLLSGRNEPDYSRTSTALVRVDVPTATANVDMVRFATSYEQGQARQLPLDQMRILAQVYQRPASCTRPGRW